VPALGPRFGVHRGLPRVLRVPAEHSTISSKNRAAPIRRVRLVRACRGYRAPPSGHPYEGTRPAIAGFGSPTLHQYNDTTPRKIKDPFEKSPKITQESRRKARLHGEFETYGFLSSLRSRVDAASCRVAKRLEAVSTVPTPPGRRGILPRDQTAGSRFHCPYAPAWGRPIGRSRVHPTSRPIAQRWDGSPNAPR